MSARFVAVVVVAACSASSKPGGLERPPAPADDIPAALQGRVSAQQAKVEAFFGVAMPRAYEVHVAPTHAAVQAFAAERWAMSEVPCWAVAMGTGSTLLLLEPSVWATEACDHAGDDAVAIDRVIAHELVHVFHGQHRPDDVELAEADAVGWFVEGLATFAAGQLDDRRLADLAALVAAGNAPARLADAWSGKTRYAVSGSLVRVIDRRVGRDKLRALLPLSTTDELLAAIGTTEAALLADWRAAVAPR